MAVACLTAVLLAGPALAQHPQAIVDRAEEDFAAGRMAEAVAGFDRLAALDPSALPWMWQRGVALYSLGRFEACATQFADYQRVNPGDLESAVWHVACNARRLSLEEAQKLMFPPGRDNRVMRPEIYEMFAGRLPPAAVVARAGVIADVALFYAHFYAGLFADINGDQEAAFRHLRIAASERYRETGGFMNVVAQVHWAQAQSRADGREAAIEPVGSSRRTE
jgi:tetratricopeptide (TPR) repeat protein